MSLQFDIDDIRAQIFEIQGNDYARNTGRKTFDIPRRSKGKIRVGWSSASLQEIADAIGIGENKYAANNAGRIVKKAMRNFAKNMFLFSTMKKLMIEEGLNEDDAFDVAIRAWRIEETMSTSEETLRSVIYG